MSNANVKKYCEKCNSQVFLPYVHCDLCFKCYHPSTTKHCPTCDKCHEKDINFCDICQKCLMDLNKHCKLCNTCHEIYYQYCNMCQTCHSNGMKWCSQCQKCEWIPCVERDICQTCQKKSQDCLLDCTKCSQKHCITLLHWCPKCQKCLKNSFPHCLDCNTHHQPVLRKHEEMKMCSVCDRVHCSGITTYFCNTCYFCTTKHKKFTSSRYDFGSHRVIMCNSCLKDIGSDYD